MVSYILQATYNNMFMKGPNENVLGFRIRSLEKPFSKTDTFKQCRSLERRRLADIKRNGKKYLGKYQALPVSKAYKPPSGSNDLKRIFPRSLRPPIPEKAAKKNDQLALSQEPFGIQESHEDSPVDFQALKHCEGNQSFSVSSIRQAFQPNSDRMIAIRMIKSDISQSLRQTLLGLHHQNILRITGIQTLDHSTYMYMDWMSCGSLQDANDSFGQFSLTLIKQITRQIVSAVQYLHSHNHIHGDISSSKTLLTSKGRVKLSIAHSYQYIQTNNKRPLKDMLWSPPERILGHQPSKQGDIWGIGCLVLLMLTGKRPWCYQSTQAFKNTEEFLRVVGIQKRPVVPTWNPEALEFLNACLSPDPEQRATLKQLEESKFLQRV